jgi:single-strand DNA-binding protein
VSGFNQVTLLGNLTRDPELRYTPKGTAIAKIGLAINRKWKSESGELKEEATFVDADAFGKTAEIAGKYLSKGSPVMISGRLRTESWDDKQSGQKRTKLGVVVENLVLLGGGRSGPAPTETARNAPAASAPAAVEPTDDDVPF